MKKRSTHTRVSERMVRRLQDHLIYDMWKVALEPAKARVVPVKDKMRKPQGGTAYYALCMYVHRALFYLERMKIR